MSLVLVDVDGTLVAGPGTERLFLRHLLRRGALGPRQLGAALRFACAEAIRPEGLPLKRNKAWLAGLQVDEVAERARRFVDETLLPRVRPEMRARLDGHRGRGDRVLLLTGTPQFLADPLAAALGLDGGVATLCASDGTRYIARAPSRHPFGKTKLDLARDLCQGGDLGEVHAYGDSRHDLALLGAVGHPVAVAPDAVLRRRAQEQGWEILAG